MSHLILAAPALPLHSAGKYVAGAYIVFLALVLVYVAIMARRLRRTEQDLAELKRQARQPAPTHDPPEPERTREPVR